MRILALYDAQGAILAATRMEIGVSAPIPSLPSDARNEVQVETFDVPEDCKHIRLDELCRSVRVDCQSRRLIDSRKTDRAS